MRTILTWILMLHLLHGPIPVPDLDGECRGTPIANLSELHAWHIILLGIRPNADVDRGPFRGDHEHHEDSSAEPIFGKYAIVTASDSALVQVYVESMISTPNLEFRLKQHDVQTSWQARLDIEPVLPVSRAACVCLCSWQI